MMRLLLPSGSLLSLGLLVSTALLSLVGCSASNDPADCTDSGTQLGGILAVDAVTLEPVCDYNTGLFSDRLQSLGVGGVFATPCDGLQEFENIDVEDRGNFRLEVYAQGYSAGVVNIRIYTDGCGRQAVSPQGPMGGLPGHAGYVTVPLTPE